MNHDDYQAKQVAAETQRSIDRAEGRIEGAGMRLKPEAADPWRHRSTGMRCQTCMWFVRKEPTGLVAHPSQAQIGRCRRHAPTMSGYPVVYMTDWCGDHRLDENKA